MTSNRQKGAAFAERVRAYLESQGLDVEPEYEANVGINRQLKKQHKFDWGSESLLVECKACDWTAGGNNPSAKLTTVNEAMLYFLGAPKSHRKMLFLAATGRRAGRRSETMGEYYVRTYGHLIPDDVEVHELDPNSLAAKQLWPAVGTSVSGISENRADLERARFGSRKGWASAEDVGVRQVLRLRLWKTYYNKGFFNIPLEFDHLVGDEGTLTLELRGNQPIEGRVNRRANPNGTARIMGGADLRDWFQRVYSEGAAVPVKFVGPRRLVIG